MLLRILQCFKNLGVDTIVENSTQNFNEKDIRVLEKLLSVLLDNFPLLIINNELPSKLKISTSSLFINTCIFWTLSRVGTSIIISRGTKLTDLYYVISTYVILDLDNFKSTVHDSEILSLLQVMNSMRVVEYRREVTCNEARIYLRFYSPEVLRICAIDKHINEQICKIVKLGNLLSRILDPVLLCLHEDNRYNLIESRSHDGALDESAWAYITLCTNIQVASV